MAAPTPAIASSSAAAPDARGILDVLEAALHASKSEWMFFRELRVGTGRRNRSAQRLDAFALNCLPHLAMKRVCYELKISRADYLCELKDPVKRRIGMRYSNEFYFIVPGGMVELREVPAECGLIEVGTANFTEWKLLIKRQAGFFFFDPVDGAYCMITVPAPWRDTPGPTWEFLAAMLRNQQRNFEEGGPAPKKAQHKFDFESEMLPAFKQNTPV